jgi:hypothetical protein
MKPMLTRKVRSNFTSKGFVEERSGSGRRRRHIRLRLCDAKGRKTRIFTFLSHSQKGKSKTLDGDFLMNFVKPELGISDNKFFEGFLNCPKSHRDLLEYLVENGKLPSECLKL